MCWTEWPRSAIPSLLYALRGRSQETGEAWRARSDAERRHQAIHRPGWATKGCGRTSSIAFAITSRRASRGATTISLSWTSLSALPCRCGRTTFTASPGKARPPPGRASLQGHGYVRCGDEHGKIQTRSHKAIKAPRQRNPASIVSAISLLQWRRGEQVNKKLKTLALAQKTSLTFSSMKALAMGDLPDHSGHVFPHR